MTKVNEQRKQMYLNGEVGIKVLESDVYPVNISKLHLIAKNIKHEGLHAYNNLQAVTFHPLSWFFEQDASDCINDVTPYYQAGSSPTEPELIVGKKYKVVNQYISNQFEIGEIVQVVKGRNKPPYGEWAESTSRDILGIIYPSHVIPFTEPRTPTAWLLNVDVPEISVTKGTTVKIEGIPDSILHHIAVRWGAITYNELQIGEEAETKT